VAKILIVEDDTDLAAAVAQALKAENHTTETAEDGQDGLHRMLSYSYDLVICDWMLPSRSGVEICDEYRRSGGPALILMLTGKSKIDDVQTGLESGADDYLTKPFHTRELLARVRALLRRAVKPAEQNTLQFADIVLDLATLSVTRAGKPVKLSKKEISLLTLFLKNPDNVFSIPQMRTVWNDTPDASDDTVRAHIKTLRKKLQGDEPDDVIVNIHGQGYRLNNQLAGQK